MSWESIAYLKGLLAAEQGTLVKDWGGRMPIALVFANTYRLGMSNLGFQTVYDLLNAQPDVVCERVFLPDRAQARTLERTGRPLLSLESQRPLADFELVAFSLSFENDYPNVLRILNLARLAWRSAAREEDEPLLIAGGAALRLNPEPMADFLDLILLGDGEILLPDLLRAWREVRLEPLPKSERLLHLARSIPGAYAPVFYEAALDGQGRLVSFTPTVPDLSETMATVRLPRLGPRAAMSRILTPDTEFASTRLIEIGRGCGRGCRFCLAGYEFRPPRVVPAAEVLEALGPPRETGERIGLVSPAVADHPEIVPLVRALVSQGREVTVSSLRLDEAAPELIRLLVEGGLRSAAVAPEAGTERLRAAINKGLSEEQILEGVRVLAEAGIKRLKFYFMIGLPGETPEDVRAIGELVKKSKDRLLRAFARRKLLPELTLTISSFVPKASTPFQTAAMAEQRVLKDRARMVQAALRGAKGIRVNFDVPKWSWLQAVFSRGDRRVSYLIEALARSGGDLKQALKEITFNPDYFVTRAWPDEERLPWDFIDRGFSRRYLAEEGRRAETGEASPACDPEVCRRCGLCPLD